MTIVCRSITLLITLVSFMTLQGQIEGDSNNLEDTTSFIIMSAETVLHRSYETYELDTLTGDVVLNQDSLVMYCDLAIVKDRIDAKAYQNVVIIHQDSIQIYADSLIYDGQSRIADLYGRVILQEGDRRLYTTELTYDVDNKRAFYQSGGTLIDQVDTIVSKSGLYDQEAKRVTLYGNVWYRDTVRTMLTDSVLYYYDLDQLNLVTATTITQDSIEIYCESGIYRLEQDRGILSNNVQVKSGEQFITSGLLDIVGQQGLYTFSFDPYLTDKDGAASSDTIRYYKNDGYLDLISRAVYRSPTEVLRAPLIRYIEATESYETMGRAIVDTDDSYVEADNIKSLEDGSTSLSGNIKLIDKESDITIYGEEAVRSENSLEVYNPRQGQPLLVYPMKSDTMLLVSDSLRSISVPEDSASSLLVASRDVKWENGSTTGLSDRFVFDTRDSIIILTGRPVLWSDSTQLTADSIYIFLRDNEVERITLVNNAFIITPDGQNNFNQIKGARIENDIVDQSLTFSRVEGNAEIHYLVEQDGAYRGINLSKSQSITLAFEDDEISRIKMGGQPESNMYEYEEGMDLTAYYLEGFIWRLEEKPDDSIFVLYSL